MQNETDIGGSAGFLQKELIYYIDATIGVWKYKYVIIIINILFN